MPQTITGVAGSSVNAQCSAPKAGEQITAGFVQAYLQSIENDLATVKAIKANPLEIQKLELGIRWPGGTNTPVENVTMSGGGFNNSTLVFVNFPVAAIGDIIHATCILDASSNDTTTGTHMVLTMVQDFGGTNVNLAMTGGHAWCLGDGTRRRFTLDGWGTVATAGALRVILQVAGTNTFVWSNYATGIIGATRSY